LGVLITRANKESCKKFAQLSMNQADAD